MLLLVVIINIPVRVRGKFTALKRTLKQVSGPRVHFHVPFDVVLNDFLATNLTDHVLKPLQVSLDGLLSGEAPFTVGALNLQPGPIQIVINLLCSLQQNFGLGL